MKRGGGPGIPDQQIHVKARRPWAAVPVDILEEAALSPLARLVLVYLLGLAARPGWDIRVRHVQHALGLSQGAWQRARRELERAGYYAVARERGDGGRLHWRHEVRDEAATIGCKSTDGDATGGNPADIHSSNNLRAKEQQKHARARARGPAAPARAAAADQRDRDQPAPPARRGELIAGVEVWTETDREAVTKLLEAHSMPAVRASAAAVRAAGQDPLPSRVATEIERRRRADRAGEVGAEAVRRLQRIEALGRIQADERLGLITPAEAAEAAQKLGIT